MPHLSIAGVTRRFGSTIALHPTRLALERGEFVTVLGPSGCGKSTLLRILMGITTADAGTIDLAGLRIDGLPPERRDIAMVFQSYALFPHMTVVGNLAFGLRMKRVPTNDRQRRISQALKICDLEALAGRLPRQLSGGQQQRVALARALVMEPALLLFDEPLSNLDAKLRESLRDDLLDLHRRVGTTSLYVTHDQAEAMAMSDRVIVMNKGRVVETGRPLDLYCRPRSAFTAAFLGHTNLLRVTVADGGARLPWGEVVPAPQGIDDGRIASVRPEDIALVADACGSARVIDAQFLGATALYRVDCGREIVRVTVGAPKTLIAPGDLVRLTLAGPLHPLVEEEGTETPAEIGEGRP